MIPVIRKEHESVAAMLATFRRLDQEASAFVEATIVMRTDFTGEEPYVGWEGLGLALNEALDQRDQYRRDAASLLVRVQDLERALLGLRGND